MERRKLVHTDLRGEVSMTELSKRSGISRKTGQKKLHQHAGAGLPSLRDASRAPKCPPTDADKLVSGDAVGAQGIPDIRGE